MRSYRTRRGDGNSFSTAYSQNYVEYEGENVPAFLYYNERSGFWHGKAAVVTMMLRDRMTDAEFEAWWGAIDDDATSRRIYEKAQATLFQLHSQLSR